MYYNLVYKINRLILSYVQTQLKDNRITILGVAYILKLLDQYSEFDSLHWFESTRQYFMSKKKAATGSQGKQNDEKLQQTVSLTLKRLDQFQQVLLSRVNLKRKKIVVDINGHLPSLSHCQLKLPVLR